MDYVQPVLVRAVMASMVVRRIILSNKEFSLRRLIDWSIFRRLTFAHPAFEGTGEKLIHSLGAPPTRSGYEEVMLRLFPDASAGRFLAPVHSQDRSNDLDWDTSCIQDQGLQELLALEYAAGSLDEVRDGWRVLAGASDPVPPPDELYEKEELSRLVREHALESLSSLGKTFLLRYFGLEGENSTRGDEAWTLEEIGSEFGISRERTRQIIQAAVKEARKYFFRELL